MIWFFITLVIVQHAIIGYCIRNNRILIDQNVRLLTLLTRAEEDE